MNKIAIWIMGSVIVIAVLLGAGLYFVSLEPEQNVPVIQDNEEVVAETEPLVLTVINNNIQIREGEDSELKEVSEKSISINEGAYVKTSLTGRAVIESKNGTTTVVDKNSEFTIVRSGQNESEIYLALGSIWAKVQKVFGKGESYQIQTNNAVITVRGTSFGVSYTTDKKTLVYVTEGTVWLLSIDPLTKAAIGQEVAVSAGQKATVIDNQNPLIQTISDADKKMEWYIFINGSPVPPASTNIAPGAPIKSSNSSSAPVQSPAPVLSQPVYLAPQPASDFPTQAPTPALYSVTPNVLYPANGMVEFSINGKDLQNAVNVLVGSTSITFSMSNTNDTIAATLSADIKGGMYDISVVFSTGQRLTLANVLTVR